MGSNANATVVRTGSSLKIHDQFLRIGTIFALTCSLEIKSVLGVRSHSQSFGTVKMTSYKTMPSLN